MFKSKHEEVAVDVKAIQAQIAGLKHAKLDTTQVQEQRHHAAVGDALTHRGIAQDTARIGADFLDDGSGRRLGYDQSGPAHAFKAGIAQLGHRGQRRQLRGALQRGNRQRLDLAGPRGESPYAYFWK